MEYRSSAVGKAAKTDDGENESIIRAGDLIKVGRRKRAPVGLMDGHIANQIVLQPKLFHLPILAKSSAFKRNSATWGHGIVADLGRQDFAMKNYVSIAVCQAKRRLQTFWTVKLLYRY